ncbi:DUF6261 family protein [Capnocytophaga sp.]|uniref:DUF6261 family protein n=1 Tax=Capnocytophaga sp. TaxID=44737 RepID=UPI0026DB86EA|nr:DUF6261 family protein [Capnocytophaga sp.]MDO5106111.1 DUF6261 family protein [Capnocytophaga sp.]
MAKSKLTKLDVYQLHKAEFGQFISRFLEDFERTDLDIETDADFKVLFEALQTQIPVYSKALEQIDVQEESNKIARLDKVRAADMQAVRDCIKPYRNSKIEARKEAYNALKIVLDQYKNVSREVYEEETKKINVLVSTLRTEKYTPYINLLKIREFIDELDTSNKEFDALFSHRSHQILKKGNLNAKDIRKQLTDNYRKLCNYIVTLADIKQDSFYKEVLEVINNSRKYYADVLAIRAGKKTKKDIMQPTFKSE